MDRSIAFLSAGILLCLSGCDSGGGISGVQPPPVTTIAAAGTSSGAPVAPNGSTTGNTVTPASGGLTSGVPPAPTAPGTTTVGTTMPVNGSAASAANTAGMTSGGYAILARAPVSGQPAGLTVNPTTNQVYFEATNDPNGGMQGHFQVIDASTYQVRTLSSFNRGGGKFAVDASTNTVYLSGASEMENGDVRTIDGLTGAFGPILVGGVSSTYDINPATHRIYSLRPLEEDVVVTDAVTAQPVATVPLGGRPFDIAVNPRSNRIYVTCDGGMCVIDGATNTIITKVALSVPVQFGLAINPETNRIYVGGAPAPPPPSSFVPPTAVPVRRRTTIGRASSDAAIQVVDGLSNTLLTTIPLPLGYNFTKIAVNTRTNRLYVASADSTTMTVIDGAANSITANVPVGNCQGGIAVNPETNRIYVADFANNSITVLSG